MASTDAKPVPQKNVAYRVTFPIMDSDGDLVTGATALDSEVSKDGGTFADCTNEATEIATSSGIYYLDLTSTEMNADTVAVIVKTSSAGAKTTTIVMYPEEAGDIRVNVTQFGGTNGTFASGRPEVNTSHIAGSAVSTSSAQIGVNVVNAAGTAWNSGAITASSIATGAIDADAVASDAVTEIQSGLATAANLATVAGYLDTEIAAILADTDELQTDWANGGRLDLILDARASQTSVDDLPTNAELTTALGTADDAVLAQVALVKERTDNLPDDPADASVVAGLIAAVDAKIDIVDTNVDAVLVDTGTTIPAQIDALNNLSAAEVNAEVVDVLTVDTFAQPGQESPAATASLKNMLAYLYKAFRNKVTQTNSQLSIYADDGSTVDHKATTSDDGTTFTRTEITSGP